MKVNGHPSLLQSCSTRRSAIDQINHDHRRASGALVRSGPLFRLSCSWPYGGTSRPAVLPIGKTLLRAAVATGPAQFRESGSRTI